LRWPPPSWSSRPRWTRGPSPCDPAPAGPGQPRNIVFVLTDDHRYDALGFLKGQSFIETPNLDALARQGVHLKNAFVTTALCSPSRASILTGQYAHQHRVVDNSNAVPDDLVFFPQYLQAAGYETAFVGKWHMGGESDAPQRGFDHWVSFRGQGTYLPSANGLNVIIGGQRGYITDDSPLRAGWLRAGRQTLHAVLSLGRALGFVPAELTRAATGISASSNRGRRSGTCDAPMWVRNQRNSWHGVDFPYTAT
jgi:N-acetylglucosamine-6-sulfatase